MYKLGFCIYGPAVSSEQRGSTRIGNTTYYLACVLSVPPADAQVALPTTPAC